MEGTNYAEKLEKKLITEFKDHFYEKLGYYPIVISRSNVQSDTYIPIMSLESLKKVFEPFLPFKYNGAIPLESRLRQRDIVELRSIFCHLARTMKYSLTTIGQFLGNRDHTTVIHNVNTFRDLVETNEPFRLKYFTILKYIKEQHEPPIMDYTNQVQHQPEPDLLS
jgi:chromosomal replication initiator protein